MPMGTTQWNNIYQKPSIQHNTNIILTYYTKTQHKIYENIINGNDMFTQNKDPKHISPPLNIPPVKISTHECNPEKISTLIQTKSKYKMILPMFMMKQVNILSPFHTIDLYGYGTNTIVHYINHMT